MPGYHYTDDERERCLLLLARNGGNAPRTARELAEHMGDRTPHIQTLYDWRDRDPDRWRQIRDEIAPALDAETVHWYRDIALIGAQAQYEATLQTAEDLRDGKIKDASTAARNLAVATGVAVDKLALLTGRPTQRVEHVDAGTLMSRLAQALGATIDSTAEEVEPLGLDDGRGRPPRRCRRDTPPRL